MICLRTHKSFGGKTQFWEHTSEATRSKMRFSTFVPDGEIRGCLLWLSGTSCTEENFIIKAGAQRVLASEQLMLIAPDTSPRGVLQGDRLEGEIGEGASYYVDAVTPKFRAHFQMESYVLHDVLSLVRDEFSVHQDAVSIFGHSMGGYGALVIGLKNPDRFRSISALAPVSHPMKSALGRQMLTSALGEDESVWREHDPTELVLCGRRHSCTILIDQGLSDELYPDRLRTQDFVEACERRGQKIETRFREGYDHSYFYVASVIDEHIRFHSQTMR